MVDKSSSRIRPVYPGASDDEVTATDAFPYLMLLAGALAALDWWAVSSLRRGLEFMAKPLVMVAFIAAAAVLEPSPSRWWFVAALVLSLVGDVFLLFDARGFLGGLAAFLVAHALYLVGLSASGLAPGGLAIGAVVATVAGAVLAPSIVGGAKQRHRVLPVPVTLYLLVLSAMLVVAFGSGDLLASVGALMFLVSDAVLGWNAFVRPVRHGRLTIHVTYHLAQGALVLSLAT